LVFDKVEEADQLVVFTSFGLVTYTSPPFFQLAAYSILDSLDFIHKLVFLQQVASLQDISLPLT